MGLTGHPGARNLTKFDGFMATYTSKLKWAWQA